MMRTLVMLMLALMSCAAIAQFTPGQVLSAAQLNNALAAKTTNASAAITGGTITGASIDLGTTSKSNGLNALSIGSASTWYAQGNSSPIFIGPGAGQSYPLTNPWPVAIGAYSLSALNQAQAEVTAVGTWSCEYLVSGNYNTCLGLHSLGAETSGSYITVVGNDAARNEQGGFQFTGLGQNAARNGALTYVTAVGDNALRGNGASLTFGGTSTTGDVVTVLMSSASADVTNSPITVAYTVKVGDTLASIAQGVANAVVANPLIGKQTAMQASLSPITGGPATVNLDFPGTTTTGWGVTVTPSISGAATETVTVGAGSTAQGVVAVGTYAANGYGITSAANSVYVGYKSGPFITSAFNDVCLGMSSCLANTSSHDNVTAGYSAAQTMTTGFDNVFVGSQAGQGITTGGDNTVIGGNYNGRANGCITTGGVNVQIGRQACVPSPTASSQLSIQNIIYGINNGGFGSTVSTGSIGIGQPAPVARFEIAGIDTSAGSLAFRITDSTGTNPLFTVNDAGGTTVYGPTSVSYSGAVVAVNDSSSSSGASFQLNSGGAAVWEVKKSSGSTLNIGRYVSGAYVDNPVSISNSTGVVTLADGLVLGSTTVKPNLSATTSSIGGSALAAGACSTGTAAVTGATTSMSVVATPVTYPGAPYYWSGYVSAAGTVTVTVCAAIAGTPIASAYNVRVIQ